MGVSRCQLSAQQREWLERDGESENFCITALDGKMLLDNFSGRCVLYLLNPLQKSIEEEGNYRRGTYRLLLLATVKQTTSSTSLVALPMYSV